MLERSKSGKLITLVTIFFKVFEISAAGLTFSSEIVNFGKEKILKCDWLATYWRRGYVDIFDGNVITKGYNKTFEVDNTTFNNDLKINRTTFEEAGDYLCLSKDIQNTSLINVIVIDENIKCNLSSSSSNFPTSLQTSEVFTVNCSITFNASSTCEVKPLWVERTSNTNLTSEISSGYNNGHMWLTANGSNGLKEDNKIWLRVVFTCNVSGTTIKEWKVVESIYDTNYISPEIKFSTDSSQWSLDGNWIIVALLLLSLFALSFFLIIAIICGRFRGSREQQPRIKPIPNIPEIRRIIRNSPVRNPFPNHRGVEEYKITPYSISFEFNKTRQSSEIQSNERLAKFRTTFEEISEYAVIDSDDPDDNYEICD